MLQNINTIQKEEEKLNINKGILAKIRNPEELRIDVLDHPYQNNRIHGYVNIIFGAMGIGKTTIVFKKWIPEAAKGGMKKTLFVAPTVEILNQCKHKFTQGLAKEDITVFHGPDEFYQWMWCDKPCVLLATQTLVRNKIESILHIQKKVGEKDFYFYSDEAHYAGATDGRWAIQNSGYLSNKDAEYIYANCVQRIAENTDNVIGLSGTPIWEMTTDNLSYDNDTPITERNKKYHICNDDDSLRPKGREFLNISSRLGGITLHDNWIHGDEAGIVKQLLTDTKTGFLKFKESAKYYYGDVMSYLSDDKIGDWLRENLNPRPLAHLVVGAKYKWQSPSSRNVFEVKDYLIHDLKKNGKYTKAEKAEYSIMISTGKITMMYNLNGGSIELKDDNAIRHYLEKRDTVSTWEDPIDSVVDIQFLISVEKFQMGFDLARITHVSQIRLRKQVLDVAIKVLQALARGCREYFGINGINSSADFRKLLSLPEIKSNPNLKIALISYASHFNQHFAHLPNERIYRAAKEIYEKDYSCSEELNWGGCTCGETCTDPLCVNAA